MCTGVRCWIFLPFSLEKKKLIILFFFLNTPGPGRSLACGMAAGKAKIVQQLPRKWESRGEAGGSAHYRRVLLWRGLPAPSRWVLFVCETSASGRFHVHLNLCLFLRSWKAMLCSRHLHQRFSVTAPWAPGGCGLRCGGDREQGRACSCLRWSIRGTAKQERVIEVH